eukprot:TRINITY_DN109252_c0_g1_i1.p1 TRINITY_DN109252_c0_g1~~TRINITY_DN109252_c0_g1_i1.p1  ORF type:complete len:228 (+),score=11.99 TRINITY_DN109252_c0_g1_i1:31-684(+)
MGIQGRAVTKQVKPRGKADTHCIAHCRNGKPCNRPIACEWSNRVKAEPVPYCEKHRRCGDGALRVVSQPVCGKILIARHSLPQGYRIVYHGVRRTMFKDDHKLDRDEDRTLWFYRYPAGQANGYIDPTGCTGSILQYAGCVGPNELVNISQSKRSYGRRNGDYAGMEYKTTMPVPANTQLVHFYGAAWWRDRPELKRCNVGTKRFPAPKRHSRQRNK